MRVTNSIYIITAIVIMVAMLALSGCSTPTVGAAGSPALAGPGAPVPTRETLLAVDRSKSTEGIRSQLLATTFDIGTSFDQAHDTMRLYRFGNSIEEVYSGLPGDDDDFALILAKEVKVSDPVGGTDYPKVLSTLADAAANAPATTTEIRVVIVGDGQNDFATDPEFNKRYRAAAERLSQNPRLKWVRFWGVNVGTREEIRSVFAPLGQKLQIMSMDQNPLAP